MSKVSFAAACAGLLIAGSAHALSNVGFESGSVTGWSPTIGATLSAESSYTVNLTDDTDPSFSYSATISPVSGNYFGLLTLSSPPSTVSPSPQSSESYTFNLSGVNSNNGDIIWVRLLTADYFYPGYNDSVTLSYNGVALDTVDTSTLTSGCSTGGLCGPDSGWRAYAVPTGTQNLAVTVTNFYDAGGSNAPIVALDFTAAPVPEPGMAALSMAGLAVLGFVARRRRPTSAEAAA